MATIIDGYNFLDGASILDLQPGRYTLEKSRQAIIRVLRAKLTESECAVTTVVFDGTEAPLGLPRRDSQFGITILYSKRGELADDLIERLIERHSHPRQLTVVSSAHRIQRAARRRQCKPVDSDVWYRGLLSRDGGGTENSSAAGADSAADEIVASDVAAWMKEFGEIDLEKIQAEADREADSQRRSQREGQGASDEVKKTKTPQPKKSRSDKVAGDKNKSPFPDGYGEDILDEVDEDFNPFPKGYGEDLLE